MANPNIIQLPDTQPPMQLTVIEQGNGTVQYRFDRQDGDHRYPTVNIVFRPATMFPNKGFDRMRGAGPCLDTRGDKDEMQLYALDPTNGFTMDAVLPVQRQADPERTQKIAIGMATTIFNI